MSAAEMHSLDGACRTLLLEYVDRHFPGQRAAIMATFTRPLPGQAAEQGLSLALGSFLCDWLIHHPVLSGGRCARELYASDTPLDDRQRKWLDVQRRAWLSVWEVLSVTADGMQMRDCLTGVTHFVQCGPDIDRSAFIAGVCALGRVLEWARQMSAGFRMIVTGTPVELWADDEDATGSSVATSGSSRTTCSKARTRPPDSRPPSCARS